MPCLARRDSQRESCTVDYRIVALMVVGLALVAQPAGAHDTGHHADLTREALAASGFTPDAVTCVQVLNWLTDYYSSQPVAGLELELAKLHFDNIGGELDDYDGVARYWSHLAKNTREAARQAAQNGDSLQLLAILGVSLHAVQDFYTHSNWVETHPRLTGQPYRAETWFSALQVGPIAGLRTGCYPNNCPAPTANHGTYDGPGMNHDSYGRPRWDEGYVFAYAASVQWVRAVRTWVDEVSPTLWDQARVLPAPAGLHKDLEASYRISEWITLSGQNGHWKGKGSGDSVSFAVFAPMWTALPDSPLVKQFKESKVHESITPNLYGDTAAPATPGLHRVGTRRAIVRVRTLDVREKNDVGLFELAIDSPGGKPDFYSVVTIDGVEYVESMQIDQAHISPSWTTLRFLPTMAVQAAIVYQIFDEDGQLRSSDDHCDIRPGAGRDLNIAFPLAGGTQVISSSGSGDSDRAEVEIEVSVDAVAPQPPLSIIKSVGEGGVNDAGDVQIVQELLNAVPPDQSGLNVPLRIDGLIGPKTITAIKTFQMNQLGFQDGKIDPDQNIMERLNSF